MSNISAWRKSTRSAPGGECIEIRINDEDHVLVRDSKNPNGPVLGFTRTGWRAFVDDVKRGGFDRG